MPIKTFQKILPGNSLFFSCEECEGEYLDTKVDMNGLFLCWITWADVQNFVADFEKLLDKYRI